MALSLTALITSTTGISPAHAQQASAPCQFILGFKTLHDLNPADIGDCVDDQAFAPNGDAQQHTTKGLMAWRKADNWTAFTNGYMTWLNGPAGLASRLNAERFPWEGDYGAPGTTAAGGDVGKASPTQPNSGTAPPSPSQPAPASGGHTWYLSSYHSGSSGTADAHLIYCDTDAAWQRLSKAYLRTFPTLAAAQASYPNYTVATTSQSCM